jgi:hypothetical protein
MNNVKWNNKRNSDTPCLPPPQLPPHTRSERGYLTDQAADARNALGHTLREMRTTLVHLADVRSCTQQHPWLVAGSAVAAGFVTGTALRGSAPAEVKNTVSKAAAPSPPGCEGGATPQPQKSVLVSIMGTLLASVLHSLIRGAFAAVVETPRARPKPRRRRRRAVQTRSRTFARVDTATRARRW